MKLRWFQKPNRTEIFPELVWSWWYMGYETVRAEYTIRPAKKLQVLEETTGKWVDVETVEG